MNKGFKSNINRYVRCESRGVPVYVHPEKPDWFIPSTRSDSVLQDLLSGKTLSESAQTDSTSYGQRFEESLFLIEKLLSRLNGARPVPYTGRRDTHELKNLKECWLHLTNRCNISCTHCLFSSGPADTLELQTEEIIPAVHEALALGCKVFYFTGGEPFIVTDFTGISDEILQIPDTHVVILTNGLLIPRHKKWLQHVDRERIHFQISIDGTRQHHDQLRGKGTFDNTMESLRLLQKMGCNCTLAMAVQERNISDMDALVDLALSQGIHTIHYLWVFLKGRAAGQNFLNADNILNGLLRARQKADEHGVLIDNIEIIKSQLFSLPGTRFDLSNAAWQSLAIGPDGCIYPTPAMVGEQQMVAGHISAGLEQVWRNSPVLERVRATSLTDSERYQKNPLKFLIGGGDIDHSFMCSGSLTGHDPYVEVYNRLALDILAQEAKKYDISETLSLVARMGERLYACDEDSQAHTFTHSNCVLSLPGKDGHTLAHSFYSAAAADLNEDIQNPVYYDEPDIAHIPQQARIRSYGCGSPVLDSSLKPGETVVDLGSGAGVECFIAAKKVGASGKVIGIDMADAMLSLAEQANEQVAGNLGYNVVEFRRGFLEVLPLKSASVDVVISNCVINLSPDKRKTLAEIFRILKPGGRLVVSDIAYNEDIPLDIKYNEKLRGECIGGAFHERELFALLSDLHFEAATLLKRFFYREIRGYRFNSVTYSARKPAVTKQQDVIYRGPFAALVTDTGTMIKKGETTTVELPGDFPFDGSVFALASDGQVTNVVQESNCDCTSSTQSPQPQGTAPGACEREPSDMQPAQPQSGCCPSPADTQKTLSNLEKFASGCMVCGENLTYGDSDTKLVCHYCGLESYGNATCKNGHFVCDACHAGDARVIIKNVCLSTTETDMIAILKRIRTHKTFPLHGPEHHALVPGIILTAYRNETGSLTTEKILTGIGRGLQVAGGSCGFMGACGSAIGVGIAFAVILQSTPLKAQERQVVQKITGEVLQSIASYTAPRCCQREAYIALQEAARLSRSYLGVKLAADEPLLCLQHTQNKECIKNACPVWPKRAG